MRRIVGIGIVSFVFTVSTVTSSRGKISEHKKVKILREG